MIEYVWRTPSPGRAAPCWPSPALAEKPVCRPRRCAAEPAPAAARQGKASVPTDGRLKTRTPETAASPRCSARAQHTARI